MKPRILKDIRFKLLAPFLGAMLIFVITSLWSLDFYQDNERAEFQAQINKQLSKNFYQVIQNETEKLESFLFFISKNNELQQAFSQRNRGMLSNYSNPIFENLRNRHQTTHFYYHNLEGKNFLRVHSPNKHSDRIKRSTLKKAIVTGASVSGIEFGLFGTFVLRVVIPWKINNQLVGYLELGTEIDHLLNRLSINNDYQLILAIQKSYIYANGLEETDFFKTKVDLLAKASHIFVIYQTFENMPSELMGFIDSEVQYTNREYSDKTREFLVSRIAISDFKKNDGVFLYYLADISGHVQHQLTLNRQVGIVGSVFGILLFLFYLVYSKRLEKLLLDSYNELENEIGIRENIQKSLTENKVKLEEIVKERDLSLDSSNKRYQTLFDKTADALLIIEGHQFVDCNQAALEMLGFNNKNELYDTHPSKLSPEMQSDGERSETKADLMIETAFRKGSHRFEWDHKRKNGEVFPVEVLLTAIPFDESQLLHVVWRDITARKQAAAEIEHQAYYDSLTGLPNRKLLLDRLGQTYKTSKRHHLFSALLFIDLDRFKSINDSLGHTFGDKLLVESAKRINSSVWDEDTVSRFGGDEYVILLKNLGGDKETASLRAKKIASRIQQSFKAAFLIDNHELHITSSIGIALFPIHEEGIEDIVKHADTAMYSAKDAGRNQIAFYLSEMHDRVIKRLNLEKDLRAAIKANDLEIYYQPQFSTSGKILAVEALIRWQHPEHGFINPEEFIAVAEETGLIYDIGDFVIVQAVESILALNKKFELKLNLSVNISPHQFRKEDFVGKIKTVMENYQLKKNFLTLEVTEGIAIENLNEAISKFDDLKHVGVGISLDDFGTGYSSLSHLKRLPINELKIDKSFVFDIQEDPQDALLVKTIINIAHQFSLTVVAEGVETKEQLEFLQQQKCDIYQGYYHSRPLPLEKLKGFITDYQ